MHTTALNSPVTLSYVAALRDYMPRQPGQAFTYAEIDCVDGDLLTCLAASNPEGKFYGVIQDAAQCQKATEGARLRGVGNIVFINGNIAQGLPAGSLPPLNYLCRNESGRPVDKARREALFNLAETLLLPGGLLNITYMPYADVHGALKFLVREFAPEMNAAQAQEFLGELKKLGGTYFASQPAMAAALDKAIASKVPDEFFMLWDEGDAVSQSFNVMVGLGPRGFGYAGDAQIASNYVELSVPPEGQPIIVQCRGNQLYEVIKDFALNRSLRSDIWCREPAGRGMEVADLFGGFSYGITMPRGQVPSEFKGQGKIIDLGSPVYKKLIELMTLMPVSVGDVLSHPESKDFLPLDIVGAVQILVACGIAQPMRGGHHAGNLSSLETPRLAGSFNQYLEKTEVSGKDLRLASPVMGDAISVSPREALVIQAIDRAGLANSVSALLPELQRLAKNPAEASRIMVASEPTPEMAQSMIRDVLERSIVQWYAYGVLEAA